MIILEKPYISDFLIETIIDQKYPVVKTDIAESYNKNSSISFIDEQQAIATLTGQTQTPIYTNSENSYSWLIKNLPNIELTKSINLFNDKVAFRNLIKDLFPTYFFKEVILEKIDQLDISKIPKPFIIKPALGFFSLAVFKVSTDSEWEETKKLIKKECDSIKELFPAEVIDLSRFIIEEFIEGTEYAFDAYFNSDGEPVILNILEHVFSSGEDVNDRVYLASKNIIDENLELFTNFLTDIGKLVDLKKIPFHVEVRKNKNGEIIPIEINPLRFGGFCTTADFTYYTFGINSYEYFFNQQAPDWEKVLKDKDGKQYCLIVLDNSSGIDGRNIKEFNYDKLVAGFNKPLHMRKMDIKKYPVFGFLFIETDKSNSKEIDNILHSDLKEFITEEK